MTNVQTEDLLHEILALQERVGRASLAISETLYNLKTANRELAVGQIKIDAARAAYESRIIA